MTSCDIHPEAVRFIAGHLAVEAILSSSVPEELSVPEEYDVVFGLSFFSHMPRSSWTRWYNALLSKVKEGGFLIFTTHGLLSRKLVDFNDFDEDGFWFAPQSEQKDLEASEYGTAVTNPLFVINQAAKSADGRLVCFREGYWWDHQDLYVFKRPFFAELNRARWWRIADFDEYVTTHPLLAHRTRFGDLFLLHGLELDGTDGQLTATIWWQRIGEDPNCDWIFFIHQIDHKGEIVANESVPLGGLAPFQLDKPIRCDAAAIGIVPGGRVSRLAVGFFRPASGPLVADHGDRDWGGRRLLLPLPGQPPVETVGRISAGAVGAAHPQQRSSPAGVSK